MLKVSYKPLFVRKFASSEKNLQDEILEKIELFKDKTNHSGLKVHKLHGKFSNLFSFSVNYKVWIVFQYETKAEVALLTTGDHDVYR